MPPERRRSGPDGRDDYAGPVITREAPGSRASGARHAATPANAGRPGPIRGYPPLPGQPDPVYPPGPFSAWNRSSTRAAWLGRGPGGPADADAEPGYSVLALSDASADATATQTFAAIGEERLPGPGGTGLAGRDWGTHTGDLGRAQQDTGPGRTGGRASVPAPGPGARGLAPGAAERPVRAGEAAAAAASTQMLAGRPGGGTDTLAGGPGGGTETLPGHPGGGTETLPGRSGGTGPGPGGGRLPGRRAAGRQPADTAGMPAPSAFGDAERGRRARTGPAVAGVSPGDADATGATATGRPDAGRPGSGRPAAASHPEPSGRRATAGRRPRRRGRRHSIMMAGLLLAPVLIVALVVGGYVYLRGRAVPAASHPDAGHAAAGHPVAAPASTAPTLGRWKHIESRSQDAAPLTVAELFPAKFSAQGAAGTLTVTRSGTKCSREVIGKSLAAAVRKANCTQVLRASYLSTDHTMMATIGVLNLGDSAAAEKAGKVAGATEFIKQLAAAHGPTRNLSKGTGIEEAAVKGHYLILIWTEFANLHAPSGGSQRTKLEGFSTGLVAGTANVSLTRRMVTGHP